MKLLRGILKHNTLLDILAVLVPAILMLLLVVKFSVNVPVTDQYEFVSIFQKIDNHTISFNDFWMQHNEHRIFFPNLILVGLALLSHWNILLEVYSSFLIACIGFTAVFMIIRRHVRVKGLRLVSLFFAAAFFFSPVQWENWLWGWQLEWFLAVACILWTVNILDLYTNREVVKKKLLAIPLVIAIVATFSIGSGIFAWIIGALIILVKKPKWKFLYVWLSVFVASTIVYYTDYHSSPPPNGVPASAILHDPNLFLTYVKTFLAYVGRPITDNPEAATLVGLHILFLFAALAIILWVTKSVRAYIAPLSLGIIGIGIGAVTIAGRIGFGIGSGMSSRYTAYSLLTLISIVIIGALLLGKLIAHVEKTRLKKNTHRIALRKFLPILLIVICMPSVGYSWYNGIHGVRTRSALYHYIATCSRVAVPDHACLYEIYFPDTVKAQKMLDYLKEKHLGGY